MKLTDAIALRAKLSEAIRRAQEDNRDVVEFDLAAALRADDTARADLQSAIDEVK